MVLKPALKPARRPGRYIVLSLFDGVGAAVAILENLFGTPTAVGDGSDMPAADVPPSRALPAWPISLDSVRKVAASLRRGRYRSAQNYFDAAVTYQEHFRGESVDPLLRQALRRYAKAVVRGLAGSKLKAIFRAMRGHLAGV